MLEFEFFLTCISFFIPNSDNSFSEKADLKFPVILAPRIKLLFSDLKFFNNASECLL